MRQLLLTTLTALALAGAAGAANYNISAYVIYPGGGPAPGSQCNLQHWTGVSWAQIQTVTANGSAICNFGLHPGGSNQLYRQDAVKSNCPLVTYWSDWYMAYLLGNWSPTLWMNHQAGAC